MKTNKLGILAIIIALGIVALTAHGQSNLMTAPIPSKLAAELSPNSAAFDPAGLSFTNVNYKAALGTQIESGTGGTLTYLQGDVKLFSVKSVDIGFGAEITKSALNSGFHSAAADLELIKNFPNWQLVGKLGAGRLFDGSVGNYAEFGFDVNYNLTAGAGLAWLGTTGGTFTYVGSGVSWADKNLSLTASQADIVKSWRIYVGVAF